jgi:hypothetical protein
MSMADAIELHDYWREFPPVHLILRAVHIKESPRRRLDPSSEASSQEKPLSKEETFQQLLEMQRFAAGAGGALGMQKQMPDHLKALADYADEVLAKMRTN